MGLMGFEPTTFRPAFRSAKHYDLFWGGGGIMYCPKSDSFLSPGNWSRLLPLEKARLDKVSEDWSWPETGQHWPILPLQVGLSTCMQQNKVLFSFASNLSSSWPSHVGSLSTIEDQRMVRS